MARASKTTQRLGLTVLLAGAALGIAWLVGLPGRAPEPSNGPNGERGAGPELAVRTMGNDEIEPALRTAALLAEIFPIGSTRSCPRWRELARLGPPVAAESGELGFDGMRMFLAREESSVRWKVGLLLDASLGVPRLAALELTCVALEARANDLVRKLRKGWAGASEDAREEDARGALLEGWRASWRDARVAAELEARARASLGGHRPASARAVVEQAFRTLSDPLRPIAYQRPGVEPPALGRRALDLLLRAGRDDLIRNALRGLDPEGRTYAAEALTSVLEPDADDRATLERVLELATPVRVQGQAQRSPDARDALR